MRCFGWIFQSQLQPNKNSIDTVILIEDIINQRTVLEQIWQDKIFFFENSYAETTSIDCSVDFQALNIETLFAEIAKTEDEEKMGCLLKIIEVGKGQKFSLYDLIFDIIWWIAEWLRIHELWQISLGPLL